VFQLGAFLWHRDFQTWSLWDKCTIAEVMLFQMRYHSLLEIHYVSLIWWTKLDDEILSDDVLMMNFGTTVCFVGNRFVRSQHSVEYYSDGKIL
jgi:hypothetical protein